MSGCVQLQLGSCRLIRAGEVFRNGDFLSSVRGGVPKYGVGQYRGDDTPIGQVMRTFSSNPTVGVMFRPATQVSYVIRGSH